MPKIEENLRIDKWLWAVRLYKTRSLASTACKNNQISIEGVYVKPSHIVKIGDVVCVKRPPIVRSYEVLGLLAQRESAKVVVDFVKDVTPQSELQKLEDVKMVFTVYRDKGAGRPTKKDRRDLEEFGYL
ncbi:MAG: RNA-binding S4 domain-containing protein [Bacteroidales bacterium]|jgi:ribosome-associated heat shock protein Hsp15|nr:RNA-binding S4 domain-containing protein [Bacteroidales bacterium]